MLPFLFAGILFAAIDEPRGCWKSGDQPCALRNLDQKFQTESFSIRKNSSIQKEADGSISLLKGELLVRTQIVLNEFGQKLRLSGVVLVRKKSPADKVEIFNIKGEVRNDQLFSVPVGFANWMGRVNRQGYLEQGIPRPISKELPARYLEQIPAQNQLEKATEIYLQAIREVELLHARAPASERDRRAVIERKRLQDLFRARQMDPSKVSIESGLLESN